MVQDKKIAERIAHVRQRVDAAAGRAGRHPDSITVMAVTKTVGADYVEAALRAGIEVVGENRVQEAESKRDQITEPARWHLIGQLQGNKARLAVAVFDAIHSIGRLSLARRVASAARTREQHLEVYVQVEFVRRKISEADIFKETRSLCAELTMAPQIRLCGLMTLPPFSPDPEDARPYFVRLRRLRDRITAIESDVDLPGLSMGMTSDFEVAIEEGSTIVRVGTAIFGQRT